MAQLDLEPNKLQASAYKITSVFCPTHWQMAKITAAKWDRGGNRTQLWDIVECPLLPAGEVWCDKRCLDQIDDADQPK
jgi:hypothetical protein